MEYLTELDRALFLLLNSLHRPWLDAIVFWGTQNFFWAPLYLLTTYILIRDKKWDSLYILLALAVTITLSDQLTASVMKPFFQRLRPSHDTVLKDLVHLVNHYRGGMYGFPSSHAANSAGVALVLYFTFRKRRPMVWILALVWAILFSYTRIYLGVHYPGDLLIGWTVGTTCGGSTVWVVCRLHPRIFGI